MIFLSDNATRILKILADNENPKPGTAQPDDLRGLHELEHNRLARYAPPSHRDWGWHVTDEGRAWLATARTEIACASEFSRVAVYDDPSLQTLEVVIGVGSDWDPSPLNLERDEVVKVHAAMGAYLERTAPPRVRVECPTAEHKVARSVRVRGLGVVIG